MRFFFGCLNAGSLATRLRSFEWKPSQKMLPFLMPLALLAGMATAAEAQTAVFSGSTSPFDTTDFAGPQGIATDASGDVFIADASKQTVYEMKRSGPGAYSAPAALPNPAAGYVYLRGVAVDSNGNLWVADFANYPATAGQVYELAYNSTTKAFAAPAKVGSGWESPWAIAADTSGNVFVTDNSANSISEISGGAVTVLNTGAVQQPRGIAVNSSEDLFVIDGNVDRLEELAPPYSSASTVNTTGFQGPGDIALDANGNIWVAEYSTNQVAELTISSAYATVVPWGSGLNGPLAVWPDADGTLLVSDYGNGAIEQIAQAVNAGTVAIGSTSAPQTLTFTFTGGASATIQAPVVVTQGATGLDFADAGSGTCTTANGSGSPYAPESTCTVNVNFKPRNAGTRYGAVKLLDGTGNLLATAYVYGTGFGPQLVFDSPATTVEVAPMEPFESPSSVAIDGSGNVYVADGGAIKEIPPGCSSSACVTELGAGFYAEGVAVDGSGKIYVADYDNNAVDEMPAGCMSSACVSTLGGGFNHPWGVAVDASGNVYVGDGGNNAVKKMTPECASAGCVTTLGGGFNDPAGVAVDVNGNVYVADSGAVKEIAPGCTSATCVVKLGGGFQDPLGVAVDGTGNIYVAEEGTPKNAVQVMAPGCASSSCVTTLRSNTSDRFSGVAVDANGNVFATAFSSITVYELELATAPSLSFPNTNVDSESSPLAVMVRNVGNAALDFPVPASGFNPSVSAGFAWDESSTCSQTTANGSTVSLAAGGTCFIEIDFEPTSGGTYAGSVVLTDDNLDATNAMQKISLSGTAAQTSTTTTAANASVTYSSNNQLVNLSATVTSPAGVVNGGTITFTVFNGATQIGSPTAAANVANGSASASYSLPGGTSAGSFTIKAVYSGATGFSGSTDTTHKLTVNSGPGALISPTSINFGTLYLGSIVMKTVTVTNTGNQSLTIHNPILGSVQGGNLLEFTTINLCPGSLAAGKSCSMTITFIAGPYYGTQTATLSIVDNAPGSPQLVSLTATVINPLGRFFPFGLNSGTTANMHGIITRPITIFGIGGFSVPASPVAHAAVISLPGGNCNAEGTCSSAVPFEAVGKDLNIRSNAAQRPF